MINSFQILGKSILRSSGYYDTNDEIQQREIFLRILSIFPKQLEKKGNISIAINFDTNKNQFCFMLDKEISAENKDYFFAFSVGASRDRKKALTTNKIDSFYNKLFKDTLDYLYEKRNKENSKQWFEKNISESYDQAINTLLSTFYIESEKGYELNRDLMSHDQRNVLEKIESKMMEKQNTSKTIPVEKLYNSFINRELLGNESTSDDKFPPIVLIKINGKTILENEQLKQSYINFLYYDFFERFFTENSIKNTICHVCTKRSEVVKQVSLPMKFYGTTNNLYFENLNNKDAFKSFALCRQCHLEVLSAMKYVGNELGDFILGVPCYLIPVFNIEEKDFEKTYQRIFRLLKKDKNSENEVQELKELSRISDKKNFYFHLLFYEKQQQQFNIIKLISHVELRGLVNKIGLFQETNKAYQLSQLKKNLAINLNDLWFHLFPTKYSHNNPDIALYRKDIVDLLESFLNAYKIDYILLIKRFMNIYKLKFFHKKTDNRYSVDLFAPFKMILILSILNQINPLKGVKKMGENRGSTVTEIKNQDYMKFFETHSDVYVDNFHRQGLFLMGTLINSIINAQRKKSAAKDNDHQEKENHKKLSSTFLRKLNFSGIPARRVNRLVGEIQNYYQIYSKDIYEESGIWGNMMDRLQGIEKSQMTPEEIIFYILTGISFSNYIGLKKSEEKRGGK